MHYTTITTFDAFIKHVSLLIQKN